MSAFYTSVVRYSNYILYRGYDDLGRPVAKKEKFKPQLYVPVDKDTGWRGFDGTPITTIDFDSMKECKAFMEKYESVVGYNIYGMSNYIHQYITRKFPKDIKFDRDKINVTTIDIETEYEGGFPDIEQADQKVLAITVKNNKDGIYYVWGLQDYDADASLIKPVVYVKCSNENELLGRFLAHWQKPEHMPDVITGWNVRFFDIPYLINRVNRILGSDRCREFSPWGLFDHRKIFRLNKEESVYDLRGIETLDYLELFQKFGYAYGKQESYKLDHIANVVLGEKKLSYEESGSLKQLYKDDFQKYIDYNMKDVQLVDRLEDKMGLITLAMTVAYQGGVNYQDTFGTTGIWESIIHRKLNSMKIAPDAYKSNIPDKSEFAGGFVKDPKVGAHDWVVSFDLNSLYPNIIVQWNMSPETLGKLPPDNLPSGVDHNLAFFESGDPMHPAQRERDICLATNGSTYTKKIDGVIPQIIVDYYDDRRVIKKQMLAAEQAYQKEKTFELEKEINRFHNQQMAIKILMNSLYGALGNRYFKYYDLRIAEGVTLTGQMVIQWAEKAINLEMNNLMKTSGVDYVIAIDTDSLYINFGDMIKKLNPKDPVKFLDKISEEHFEPILAKAYDDLFKKFNCHNPRMEMAREVIADRGIWTAKKRYILNVWDSEGVRYNEAKLKIMGIEAVKSSTPAPCRKAIKDALKVIMSGTEDEMINFIDTFRNEFKSLPPEDISFPRTVSDVVKYKGRNAIYEKGTPIHARGSLLFNHHVKRLKLEGKYSLIGNGEKVKFCYLRSPNPIHENVMSFIQDFPRELGIEKYIDYDLQFEKSFLDPLKIILDVIQWEVEKTATLESFFA